MVNRFRRWWRRWRRARDARWLDNMVGRVPADRLRGHPRFRRLCADVNAERHERAGVGGGEG